VLTAETKRRLDACRDILVGKLPLPTDQIELITLALIYKFMDDLDEESVKVGGKRSFFVGPLEKYPWRALLPELIPEVSRRPHPHSFPQRGERIRLLAQRGARQCI
jgi:hypothetical protein